MMDTRKQRYKRGKRNTRQHGIDAREEKRRDE